MLQRLAVTDPELAQIAYGLLPRDVFISVEQRPGQSRSRRVGDPARVIDLDQTNANGAELGPALETIETLRADQAKSIE